MKKEKIIFIISLVMMLLATSISVYATSCLYNSSDVSYSPPSGSGLSANVQDSLTEVYSHCTDYTEIRAMIYPVGSIYLSVTDDTVAKVEDRFGGTWEAYGQGRTLIGAGTGTDSNSTSQTFTVNSTGGEYTHKLTSAESGVPAHSHSYDKVNSTTESHTLTISEIPSHNHGGYTSTDAAYNTTSIYNSGGSVNFYAITWGGSYVGQDATFQSLTRHRHTISSQGGGGGHSHSIKTTSTSTGNNTAANAANNHNNIQPYITVYMYKRVS